MNKVILTGNIVSDLEVKKINDRSFLTNKIAVRRDYKNDKGEFVTDFISFKAFNGQADYLAKFCHKGDKVEIVGAWYTGTFQGNDGVTKYSNDCMVEKVNLLVQKKDMKYMSSENKLGIQRHDQQEEAETVDTKAFEKPIPSPVSEEEIPF